MAPEMIKRQPYGTKVDLWSLGVVVMEMVEKTPPYHNCRSLRAMFNTASKGAPPLKKPKKWSNEFKSFLSRSLEMDPDKRASADELLEVHIFHPFSFRFVSFLFFVLTHPPLLGRIHNREGGTADQAYSGNWGCFLRQLNTHERILRGSNKTVPVLLFFYSTTLFPSSILLAAPSLFVFKLRPEKSCSRIFL